MDILVVLTILVVLLILLVGAVIYIQLKNTQKPEEMALDKRLSDLRETIDTRLNQNTKRVDEQMRSQSETSQKLVRDITEELTEIKETNKHMLAFTDKLQSLEQVLTNPIKRGVVGEYVLESVITNVLSAGTYELQYTFPSGVRADAVIFLHDKKKICIDAKFSLNNYIKLLKGKEENSEAVSKQLRSDLKDRIKETAKYILPEEGTLDYAFMFVPSESLYYDVLTGSVGQGANEQNLLEYAFNEYKVIIVSPTTLFAYLQAVVLGLRSLKIEKHTQEIIKRAGVLQKHLDSYAENFMKVGKSLGTTVSHFNTAQQKYGMIDKDFLKMTGERSDFVPELLEKPRETEE